MGLRVRDCQALTLVFNDLCLFAIVDSAAFRLPKSGGERGIRTTGEVTPTPVFKTGAFDHSAISPHHLELRVEEL